MNKIDKRRKYLLIVDIETANMTEEAIAYDVGFAVSDKRGRIYERGSYMVAEMFLDKRHSECMNSAYYAEKLPRYWKDFEEGTRILASIYKIRRNILDIMKAYKIKDVFAYNAIFDKTGLDRTIRYLSQSRIRYFFPYGTQIHCIWHMATQTIAQQKSYFKMAFQNHWISASGNLQTGAEYIWKYLSKDATFKESHTGFEDVEIECKIMVKCFQQHKKMDTQINRLCWRLPQKSFADFLGKEVK